MISIRATRKISLATILSLPGFWQLLEAALQQRAIYPRTRLKGQVS